MQKKEAIFTSAIIIIAIYTITVSLVSQVFPAMQTTRTLSSSGTIQTIGVGVYSDYQGNNPLTSIPWGTLEPGSSQQFTCYIKNEGNGQATLSMYTSNWNPAIAPNYLELTWNYGGQTLDVDDVLQVIFTLTVSSNIQDVTSFSFDITIVGNS